MGRSYDWYSGLSPGHCLGLLQDSQTCEPNTPRALGLGAWHLHAQTENVLVTQYVEHGPLDAWLRLEGGLEGLCPLEKQRFYQKQHGLPLPSCPEPAPLTSQGLTCEPAQLPSLCTVLHDLTGLQPQSEPHPTAGAPAYANTVYLSFLHSEGACVLDSNALRALGPLVQVLLTTSYSIDGQAIQLRLTGAITFPCRFLEVAHTGLIAEVTSQGLKPQIQGDNVAIHQVPDRAAYLLYQALITSNGLWVSPSLGIFKNFANGYKHIYLQQFQESLKPSLETAVADISKLFLWFQDWQNRCLGTRKKSRAINSTYTAEAIVVQSVLLYRQTLQVFTNEEGINSCCESLADFISCCSRSEPGELNQQSAPTSAGERVKDVSITSMANLHHHVHLGLAPLAVHRHDPSLTHHLS
ncbi:hypothetical protein GH733_004706 [Mirounga leonina]|nr:hypothetical protein GH733_004706 [Mirounga leonina]